MKGMHRDLRAIRKKQLFKYWGVKGFAPCWWCLRLLEFHNATIEHLIPLALNGTNSLVNLRLACSKCNSGHVNPLDPEHCHISAKLKHLIF